MREDDWRFIQDIARGAPTHVARARQAVRIAARFGDAVARRVALRYADAHDARRAWLSGHRIHTMGE